MRILLFTLCYILAVQLTAQRASIQSILATSLKDPRVQLSQKLVQDAAPLSSHDIYVRSVEARLGINGSALGDTIYGYIRNEDAYGLILSPNSLREIKQQKKVIKASQAALGGEAQLWIEDALFERYTAIIDAIYSEKTEKYHKEVADLLKQRNLILRATAESGLVVKPNDVVKTERQRLQNALQIRNWEAKNQVAASTVAQFLGIDRTVEIDTTGMVSLASMLTLVKQTVTQASQHPELRSRSLKLDEAKAKLQLIKSQDRQIFQSLRIGYERPRFLLRPTKFNTANNFSLRVGVSVPLPGNHRFRESLAQIQYLEDAYDLAQKQVEIQSKSLQIQAEALGLEQFYMQIKIQEQESLLPSMLKNETILAALSSLEINELRIASMELKEHLLETEYQIAVLHIRFLHEQGLLSAQPYVDYLSEVKRNF
jgi:hypothetical protein